MPTYTLPELPYDVAALEPHYAAQVVELHHGKHHAAYVKGANTTLDKLAEAREKGDFDAINQLQKSLAFHLSGHVLHSLLWKNMSPRGGGQPDGELGAAIKEFFGGFDGFKRQLSEAATNIQGSAGARSAGSRSASASSSNRFTTTRATSATARAASGARYVGARVLPAVQNREERLDRGLLENRQLAGRRDALQQRARVESRALSGLDRPSVGVAGQRPTDDRVAPSPSASRALPAAPAAPSGSARRPAAAPPNAARRRPPSSGD